MQSPRGKVPARFITGRNATPVELATRLVEQCEESVETRPDEQRAEIRKNADDLSSMLDNIFNEYALKPQ
jgi:hypothetical protein